MLGLQPVATHFARQPAAVCVEQELGLGVCHACGLIQLVQPFPYRTLVPPFDWITYREPERHLDAVVEKVLSLPGVDTEAVVAGITYKDHTTVERFAQRGFAQTWCVDLFADLGAVHPYANIESAHALLTPEKAEEIVRHRGLVDVLIVRHVVEHAEVPWRFLKALGTLVRDGGYIVVEVPDCTANLDLQDYSMIWEEHSLYFTPETFGRVMQAADCISLGVDIHPYVFENCLVQIGRKTSRTVEAGTTPAAEMIRLRDYVDAFPRWTRTYRTVLGRFKAAGHGVALYGAGHIASAFVNFNNLADQFRFVVDDTPQKQGLFMAKCGLPIVPRDALDAREVSICLFGVAPEVEDKIITSNRAFVDEGGTFYSILAASERSLRHALPSETSVR